MTTTCPRRPGPGWKRAGLPDVPVWEHSSGVCVHILGVAKFDGIIVSLWKRKDYEDFDRAIAQQGGNRRRGAMVWALAKSEQEKLASAASGKTSQGDAGAA